eukprot:gene5852-6138_t
MFTSGVPLKTSSVASLQWLSLSDLCSGGSLIPQEPKKKGRFMIIENSGSTPSIEAPPLMAPRACSAASVEAPPVMAYRTSESGQARDPSPRPPLHPLTPASSSPAVLPASFVVPKLTAMLEQATLLQENVQKVLAVILDVEKGKPLPLYKKTVPRPVGSGAASPQTPSTATSTPQTGTATITRATSSAAITTTTTTSTSTSSSATITRTSRSAAITTSTTSTSAISSARVWG